MQHSERTDLIIYRNIQTHSCREIARLLMGFWAVNQQPQYVSPNLVKLYARRRGWLPIPKDGLPDFKPATSYLPKKYELPKRLPIKPEPFIHPDKSESVDKYAGTTKPIRTKKTRAPTKASPTVKALLRLKNHECKWPIGDVGDEDFHFCGKRRQGRKSYCSEHLKLRVRQDTIASLMNHP